MTSRACLLSAGDRISHWTISKLLGRGKFGEVYAGSHETSGAQVAIKVESVDVAKGRLEREALVYEATDGLSGQAGVHWFGRQGGVLALVLDRLGPSVKAMHRAVGNLTHDELRLVASETLHRLEELHGRGWLHGDIKPDNLLLPRGTTALKALSGGRPLVHCIDFGMSLPLHKGKAETPSARRGTLGAVRYASVSNQMLLPLGPRDDLEALAYSLVYLHRGQLPWSQVSAPTQREKFVLIRQAKQHEEPPSSPAAVHAPRRRLAAFFCRVPAPVPSDACPRAARLDYAALRALLASDAHRDRSERKGGGTTVKGSRKAVRSGISAVLGS